MQASCFHSTQPLISDMACDLLPFRVCYHSESPLLPHAMVLSMHVQTSSCYNDRLLPFLLPFL